MRLLTLIVAWIVALPAVAENVLPSKLVGVWATEDSVFRGSGLIGGSAIYLDTNGEGAVVGAPLPVGMCGDRICTPIIGVRLHASYDANDNRIRATLIDGKKAIEVSLAYDSATNVLVMQSGTAKEQRFIRREPEIPLDLKAALQAAPGTTLMAKPPQ
jgi:hypothetical protein